MSEKMSFNRRKFIGGSLVAFAGLASQPVMAENEENTKTGGDPDVNSHEKISRSKTAVKGFLNPEMDFQLLRSIGVDSYGGSAVGECLYAATKIKEGDPAGWTEEFGKLAKRVEEEGSRRLEKGHRVSAGDQFLRACTHYRAAEYFADPLKLLKNEYGLRSRDCFIKALELMACYGEAVNIPYEDKYMPGYFLSPDRSGKKRKTIMIISGFDGTAEEVFFGGGKAALERDYNVLLFDGPGQVGMRRFFPDLPFRPDYEVPLKSAVDYILSRPETDTEKLAFWGLSMGGYLSVRGTSFEKRIKALIADSPIIDLHAYMTAFFNPDMLPEDIAAKEIQEIPDSEFPAVQKIMTLNMCMRFGKATVKTTYEHMKEFNAGEAIKNISCPCLALAGEGEGEEPLSQAKAFCSGISGESNLYIFTQEEGADAHCQMNNLPFACAVVYDWLDEIFSEKT